jgi:type II secretory pathway predicted ATPase ExeA
MYQSHFGLRESPFNITPNPAFFYSGNARGDILDACCTRSAMAKASSR